MRIVKGRWSASNADGSWDLDQLGNDAREARKRIEFPAEADFRDPPEIFLTVLSYHGDGYPAGPAPQETPFGITVNAEDITDDGFTLVVRRLSTTRLTLFNASGEYLAIQT